MSNRPAVPAIVLATVVGLTLAIASPSHGGSVAETANSERSNGVSWSSEPKCDVYTRSADPAPTEEYPSDAVWTSGENVQETFLNLNAVLGQHDNALIGRYIDFNARTLNVVVDPDAKNRVDSLVRDLRHSNRPSEIQVDVRPGCRSKAVLVRTSEAVERRDWHNEATDVPIVFGLDPASSTVRVTVGDNRQDIAQSLRDRYQDVVTVTVSGRIGRASRLDDASPHFGGARIQTDVGECTTGFAMDKNGGRWMSTAGHCSSADGTRVDSGAYYVGQTYDRSIDPDVMLIGSGIETYQRSIYTDPGDPTSRLVSRVKHVGIGTGLCLSGSFTRAVCGASVTADGQTLCDDLGCTHDLWEGEKSGSLIVQAGDSGGPLYGRITSTEADIRGLIVAEGAALSGTPGSDTVLFHDVSTVELGLSANVAVTCCTSSSW